MPASELKPNRNLICGDCGESVALFPGSPNYKEGGEPGTFYHVRDVKGRHEVDTR